MHKELRACFKMSSYEIEVRKLIWTTADIAVLIGNRDGVRLVKFWGLKIGVRVALTRYEGKGRGWIMSSGSSAEGGGSRLGEGPMPFNTAPPPCRPCPFPNHPYALAPPTVDCRLSTAPTPTSTPIPTP